MSLVVVTRLGIGVRSPSFFEEHLRLLELTAAASLASQSDQDFKWVVITDLRAPDWVDDRLKALRRSCSVWRIDPLKTGLNPTKEISRRLGRCYVARLDDDDLLHRDFVRHTKEAMSAENGITALTFPQGIYLSAMEVRAHRYPWIAIGLTTFDPAGTFNGYSVQHNKLPERRPDVRTLEIETEQPMWVRTLRHASSSGFHKRSTNGAAVAFNGNDFGLSWWSQRKLRHCLRDDGSASYDVIVGRKMPSAIRMKSEALKLFREAMSKEDRATAEMMAQIFYRL